MSVSESDGNGKSGLRPIETPDASIGVPFAAMAEALRANAEALSRIDSNQRKIAESIERGDKAGQVVTSTRALNETFRGLSEIQRGLLDAVVRERGRGRGMPFAFAAIAILAAALGFLLFDRLTSDDSVPRAVYEQLRATSDERADRIAELRASAQGSSGEVTVLRRRLEERDSKLGDAERKQEGLERRNRRLLDDLDAQQSRLKNFLAVKDIADRVGIVEVRNAQLENENRSLKYRAERAEKERERLMIMMGEKKIAEHGPDPKLIEAALKRSGKLRQDGKPDPDALVSIDRRRVLKQLNALLRQAPGEETYEILSMVGIRKGTILTDVQIGHYRNAGLLNSLHCKELEVFCDRGKDTVELRCKKGFLSVTRQPGKRIPLDEAGFSIFLREVGLKRWLERAIIPVEVAKGGRLTWKPGP